MELYVAILTGAVINLLLGFNEAIKKPDYRFSIFFKQNIVATVLNIIIGSCIVYDKDGQLIKQLVGEITFLTAVFIGSSGQFYWKKVTNILNPDKPTLVGSNAKAG
jgi:hypothetical protein